MTDQQSKGYSCATCSEIAGMTIGQAKEHHCLMGVENIWVMDDCVYPYDPVHQNDEIDENATENGELWPTAAKKLLIDLYPKYILQLSNRQILSKEKIFAKIADEMGKFGWKYNAVQVKNRWRCFEKSFKNVTRNNNKTGRGYMKLEFRDELYNIFHKEPRFYPDILTSSAKTINNKRTSDTSTISTVTNTTTTESDNCSRSEEIDNLSKNIKITGDNEFAIKKKKLTYKATATVLDGIREEMKRRNDLQSEKLKIEVKKNELLERKLALMEQYLKKK